MSDCANCITPHLSVAAISFSDGKTITLGPTDTVVLVGPNNSGKTQALRDLETRLHSPNSGIVLKDVHFARNAHTDDLQRFVREHSQLSVDSGGREVVAGLSYRLASQDIAAYWENTDHLGPLASALLFFARTDDRLGPREPVASYDPLNEHASHPVHLLYDQEELANQVSSYFYEAFGQELTIYYRGAARIPLLVGPNPSLQPGEDRVSQTYADRLISSTAQLGEQAMA